MLIKILAVGGGAAGGRAPSGKGGSGGSDRRSIAGSVGSAGSEGGIIKQLGLYVRVKSDSGKKLSDQEILQQIKVGQKDKKSLLLSFLRKCCACLRLRILGWAGTSVGTEFQLE